MSRDIPPGPRSVPGKGLRSGAMSLGGGVVLGLASTAPAYSLAATLGFVVLAGAGVKAPAVMLIAFVPMYLIAVAYRELNAAEPDCGTTFTWATRAFGPVVGWMGGWGIIVADVICMANLAQIAGASSFVLAREVGLDNQLDATTAASTTAGLAWIAAMTWVAHRGIEVSVRLQQALLVLELLTLALFAGVALVRATLGPTPGGSLHPSWSWLWPADLTTSQLASSVLLAVFIYWGWDSAVSTNEESADPRRTPGRAAVLSTVLLLGIYVLVSVAAIAFAGVSSTGVGLGNPAHVEDVFTAIGPALFGSSVLGHAGSALLAVSILSSAAASTQTTILPTARTALAMGVHRALPRAFAEVDPRRQTPTWATAAMGAVSMAFYLGMTLLSEDLLAALIGAIGLQIAFYYGLTGFACAWCHRRSLRSGLRIGVTRVVLPLFGGVLLTAVFSYALVSYAAPDHLVDARGRPVTLLGLGAVAVVGMGSLVAGLLLMAAQWAVAPEFFRGATLPRRTYPPGEEPDVAARAR